MSYDLAVWDGDRPLDDDRACLTYDELYERYLASDGPYEPETASITAYLAAFREQYPNDEQLIAEKASPRVDSEVSGPIVYLTMSYRHAEDVADHAADLARRHGLVCFDPQIEQLL